MTKFAKLPKQLRLKLIKKYPILEQTINKIRVEPIKKCWFISEDWSVYSTINKERAHRFTYRVFNPSKSIIGFEICHKCDRPGCINPEHLFRGTVQDNRRDAIKKGRIKLVRYFKKDESPIKLNELRKQDNLRQLRYTIEELQNANGNCK